MGELGRILDDSAAAIRSLAGLEEQVVAAADLLAGVLKAGGKILACGNGGSAADASHLVTEFVVRFVEDRRPWPAIALTESGSTLTAAGNDYGFDEVFSRQVRGLGSKGDVLVAFTTSGNSANVLRALDAAAEAGLPTIAMLGRDGGAAKGKATIELIVPSDSTARIQEGHGVLIHALLELVEQRLPTC